MKLVSTPDGLWCCFVSPIVEHRDHRLAGSCSSKEAGTVAAAVAEAGSCPVRSQPEPSELITVGERVNAGNHHFYCLPSLLEPPADDFPSEEPGLEPPPPPPSALPAADSAPLPPPPALLFPPSAEAAFEPGGAPDSAAPEPSFEPPPPPLLLPPSVDLEPALEPVLEPAADPALEPPPVELPPATADSDPAPPPPPSPLLAASVDLEPALEPPPPELLAPSVDFDPALDPPPPLLLPPSVDLEPALEPVLEPPPPPPSLLLTPSVDLEPALDPPPALLLPPSVDFEPALDPPPPLLFPPSTDLDPALDLDPPLLLFTASVDLEAALEPPPELLAPSSAFEPALLVFDPSAELFAADELFTFDFLLLPADSLAAAADTSGSSTSRVIIVHHRAAVKVLCLWSVTGEDDLIEGAHVRQLFFLLRRQLVHISTVGHDENRPQTGLLCGHRLRGAVGEEKHVLWRLLDLADDLLKGSRIRELSLLGVKVIRNEKIHVALASLGEVSFGGLLPAIAEQVQLHLVLHRPVVHLHSHVSVQRRLQAALGVAVKDDVKSKQGHALVVLFLVQTRHVILHDFICPVLHKVLLGVLLDVRKENLVDEEGLGGGGHKVKDDRSWLAHF
ncbi:hypothetical protein TYRP_020524 [Tyrophagus putrescentiae]|nr:hypothetical protein TYRP_020524 [Tyrophagus putrescentiae]